MYLEAITFVGTLILPISEESVAARNVENSKYKHTENIKGDKEIDIQAHVIFNKCSNIRPCNI